MKTYYTPDKYTRSRAYLQLDDKLDEGHDNNQWNSWGTSQS